MPINSTMMAKMATRAILTSFVKNFMLILNSQLSILNSQFSTVASELLDGAVDVDTLTVLEGNDKGLRKLV